MDSHGYEFRGLLMDKGLTIKQLAKHLKLSQNQVNYKIKSENGFNLKEIKIILELTGYTFDQLFNFKIEDEEDGNDYGYEI